MEPTDPSAGSSEQLSASRLAELSDPFADSTTDLDPFGDGADNPFADPASDAFDPFAESAQAAGNQFKLPTAADDEGGMPPTARAPLGISVDLSETEIQIEIAEEDEQVEEEAPISPPISSRSPFGQSYLRSQGEGADADRPTVRAPATYPEPELLEQLHKGDDD